jgi:hypothetical protein
VRTNDAVRLTLIALALLVLQLVWYLKFPGWRTVDFYLVFLLLLGSARGPVYGGIFAILGGAVLDSFSAQYAAFHMLFYLLPVAIGTLIRSRMLLSYSQLGAGAVVVLLLVKVLSQLIAAMSMYAIDSPVYLFKLNYVPLLFEAVLVFIFWDKLVRAIPEVVEGKVLA